MCGCLDVCGIAKCVTDIDFSIIAYVRKYILTAGVIKTLGQLKTTLVTQTDFLNKKERDVAPW